jgi:hypothetical protein
MLSRAAILLHDFPNRYVEDACFTSVSQPVTRRYLEVEGLSKKSIDYVASWPGFVKD